MQSNDATKKLKEKKHKNKGPAGNDKSDWRGKTFSGSFCPEKNNFADLTRASPILIECIPKGLHFYKFLNVFFSFINYSQ
jgi:hypothetical protein